MVLTSHRLVENFQDLRVTLSVTLAVDDIVDDLIVEANETVIVTLASVSGDPDIGGMVANAATVTITDNDSALVSIAATDPAAAETATNAGEFTITLSNQSSTDTTVNYTVSGTSTDDTDFPSIGSSIVIPANTLSVTLAVDDIVDDSIVEANETVIVTLASVSGDPDIGVDGGANAATVTITDNDSALVSIAATDPAAAETATNAGEFTITLSNQSSTSMSSELHGEVVRPPMVLILPSIGSSIVIPANTLSVTLAVDDIVDDLTVEANETVIVTLRSIR